jgi:hypothetical protein
MALLTAKAADFGNGHTLDAGFGNGITHIVQFEGFDYCNNQFHLMVSLGRQHGSQ